MAKKSTKKVAKSGKNAKGQFVRGHKKLGGRDKGVKNHDGLTAVLNMLKGLISEEKNLELLKNEMQMAFNEHPLGFYYKFIMPLYPKSINLDTPGDLLFQISKSYKPKVKKEKRE